MTNGSTRSEDRAPAAKAPRRDLVVALVLVGLGVGVIGLSLGVPAGVQTDPLGPRAFPLALGAAIGACGLLLALSTALGDRWATSAAMFVETPDDDAGAGGLASPWRLAGAVAATAAYLVAFERLGYLLATPLYVVAILLLQPGVRRRAFLAAPVLVTVALYAAFRYGLLIPVPDGLLESWLPW